MGYFPRSNKAWEIRYLALGNAQPKEKKQTTQRELRRANLESLILPKSSKLL